jgi:hypothetical protein
VPINRASRDPQISVKVPRISLITDVRRLETAFMARNAAPMVIAPQNRIGDGVAQKLLEDLANIVAIHAIASCGVRVR